jgi:hypothetical protein
MNINKNNENKMYFYNLFINLKEIKTLYMI